MYVHVYVHVYVRCGVHILLIAADLYQVTRHGAHHSTEINEAYLRCRPGCELAGGVCAGVVEPVRVHMGAGT